MSEKDVLPITIRLDRFRAMADEAKASAQSARTAEARREYERLARAWDDLIHEMEEMNEDRSRSASDPP